MLRLNDLITVCNQSLTRNYPNFVSIANKSKTKMKSIKIIKHSNVYKIKILVFFLKSTKFVIILYVLYMFNLEDGV